MLLIDDDHVSLDLPALVRNASSIPQKATLLRFANATAATDALLHDAA